jgi:hypothetical protein
MTIVFSEWDDNPDDCRIGYDESCAWIAMQNAILRDDPKGMLKIPKKSENCLDDSTDD